MPLVFKPDVFQIQDEDGNTSTVTGLLCAGDAQSVAFYGTESSRIPPAPNVLMCDRAELPKFKVNSSVKHITHDGEAVVPVRRFHVAETPKVSGATKQASNLVIILSEI